MSTTNGCCDGCGATIPDECFCPAGLDGATIRFGDGVPTIISTDKAGDIYIQNDSTPLAGEVWGFDGVTWTDEGFAMKGDTGAAGSSGSAVIENTSGNDVAFNSVGLTTINTQAFTLDTDGSYVEIENKATITPNSTDNHCKLTVGGVIVFENTPNIMSIAHQKIVVRITRVNNVTIQFERWILVSNTFTLSILPTQYYFSPTTDGVADMDSNALTAVLEWGGIGTSKGFVITKYVK